jgi:hypothetical protein
MSRNYFSLKTGHKTSDEYFKRIPIWYDSDMLKVGATWFVIGIIVGLFVRYTIFLDF